MMTRLKFSHNLVSHWQQHNNKGIGDTMTFFLLLPISRVSEYEQRPTLDYCH